MKDQESSEFGAAMGWFCAMRTEAALELIAKNPNAYCLAAVIGHRARWTDGFNRHGLKIGEAFLGDFQQCGMTQKEYRTAKKILEENGFASFVGTNKGTVARLMDSRLFSIIPLNKGEQEADRRRKGGYQRANNKYQKKEINIEHLIDATGIARSKPILNGHRLKTSLEKENELIGRLRAQLGSDEMARCGGNWRANWVRRHPDVIESGLNEMASMMKEGKPIHNPGAWLMDWCQRRTKKKPGSRNDGTYNGLPPIGGSRENKVR